MTESTLKRTKKRYLFLTNPLFMKYNIKQLPPQLRNKLYIMCMRKFWRSYVPLTAKTPSWHILSITRSNQLFYAQHNNIHFLHLPCNTLYKNRKYIVGCQCHFCKYGALEEHKKIEQQKNIESIHYFNKVVPFTDSKWNNPLEYIYDPKTTDIMNGYTIFTPYYDLRENIKETINGEPIEFSPETKALFPS